MHPTLRLAVVAAVLLSIAAPARAQGDSTGTVRFVGTWRGTLSIGAVPLRLMLQVQHEGTGLTGALVSLDQGNGRIPANIIAHGDSITVSMPAKGAFYAATLTSGDTLRGTFTQRNASFPLVMAHTANVVEAASTRRPQDPAEPVPYRSTDVTVASVPGVRLGCTLTEPPTAGPLPAVVLSTGSGPQDRDEAMMGHRPFLVLADYLTRRGIVVLRCDDRGVAKSTGSFASATTMDFADDAEAGVNFLRGRSEIAKDRIGIIGHSEGGVVAPIVAARSRDVAFVVLMAGPGIAGDSLLGLQGAAQLRLAGVSGAQFDSTLAFNARVRHAVATSRDAAEARKKVNAVAEGFVATKPAAQQAALRAQLARGLAPATSDWTRGLITYDPRPTLQKVRVPVLALNGTLDSQVPYREDLDGIAAGLTAGGNRDFETVAMPGLNHLFQTAKTGSPAEYATIDETIAPAALSRIGDWIVKRFGPK